MATTWNPADKGAQITLSNGNLTAEAAIYGAIDSVRATTSVSSGKLYWEIYVDYSYFAVTVGVGNSSASLVNLLGTDANGWGYKINGDKINNNSNSSYGDSFAAGDIVGVALNLDTGKIWFAKNGVWQNSGNPVAGINEAFSGLSGTLYPMGGCGRDGGDPNNDKQTIRPDSSSQSYTPPSGFYPINEEDTICLFDGRLSINSPINLLDGKARVKNVTTNQLDGKARVKSVATNLLDGKARTKDSVTNLLDGKAVLKDSVTNLLDGKATIEGLSFNLLDGKAWVKEVIEGGIELPSLDILGNTGAVGDITLPFFKVCGEANIGVDAQGNITLPGLGVVGFIGAKCNYNLPSLGISGTSVVGTVASGNVVLPIFTVKGQTFTDAIVNGDITLPFLRVNASSIHGSLCIGEVSLPALGINATAKVGVVCTGTVTLPCLVIGAKGGHIPIGNGDVILPLLQVYSTASILADPRDGCHILRHHRWRQ